jgi:oligopeptide transport system permease protein
VRGFGALGGGTRASLVFLGALAVACLIGPAISPHPYDRVYRDYILVGPSLDAHPKAGEIDRAVADLARDLKLAASWTPRGDGIALTLRGTSAVDARALRYLTRADMFGTPTSARQADGDRTLVAEVPLRRDVFLLGTDANGRDLLTRMLVAGRVSLAVGVLASAVALAIGVTYGAIAGYAGGRIDAVMMRAVDVVYALPFIFFVIVLVVLFGRNFLLIFVAIGAVEWLDMARIVRGQTLSLKQRDFVAAAEALGVAPIALVTRHIVPNMLDPIVAYLSLLVPRVILAESFVSFLGLGVQEPLTSWGLLIADGARDIQGATYLLAFPALLLAATLVAFATVGEGLRNDRPARR